MSHGVIFPELGEHPHSPQRAYGPSPLPSRERGRDTSAHSALETLRLGSGRAEYPTLGMERPYFVRRLGGRNDGYAKGSCQLYGSCFGGDYAFGDEVSDLFVGHAEDLLVDVFVVLAESRGGGEGAGSAGEIEGEAVVGVTSDNLMV